MIRVHFRFTRERLVKNAARNRAQQTKEKKAKNVDVNRRAKCTVLLILSLSIFQINQHFPYNYKQHLSAASHHFKSQLVCQQSQSCEKAAQAGYQVHDSTEVSVCYLCGGGSSKYSYSSK